MITDKQREQTIGAAQYHVMQHTSGTWSIVKIELFFFEVRGGFKSRAAATEWARAKGYPVDHA